MSGRLLQTDCLLVPNCTARIKQMKYGARRSHLIRILRKVFPGAKNSATPAGFFFPGKVRLVGFAAKPLITGGQNTEVPLAARFLTTPFFQNAAPPVAHTGNPRYL